MLNNKMKFEHLWTTYLYLFDNSPFHGPTSLATLSLGILATCPAHCSLPRLITLTISTCLYT